METAKKIQIVEELAQDRCLWYQIVKRVKDENVAEDVLQQVLVIVYQKLPQLKDPAKLKSWVFQIMKNEVLKTFWKQNFSRLNEEIPICTKFLQEINYQELQNLLKNSLKITSFYTPKELPIARILIKDTLKGISYKTILKNIQQEFNYDINYTTTLIYRIRRKLNLYLSKHGYTVSKKPQINVKVAS